MCIGQPSIQLSNAVRGTRPFSNPEPSRPTTKLRALRRFPTPFWRIGKMAAGNESIYMEIRYQISSFKKNLRHLTAYESAHFSSSYKKKACNSKHRPRIFKNLCFI